MTVGYFITLEGPDGSGKTTQAHLLRERLASLGYSVILTREPGGTQIGDQIRTVLHDKRNTEMTARAEILLYSASRAQHVAQIILPALIAGEVVISDRFADSTLAYQGYGRGLDLQSLYAITEFATRGLVPNLTLYLDIASELGLRRRRQSGEEWNRLDAEALDFHRRTRAGYLELAGVNPERWVVIDASQAVSHVQSTLFAITRSRIESWCTQDMGQRLDP